jgi:hypothetical protein
VLQQPLGLTSSSTTTLAWPTRGSDPTAAASRVCARDGKGTRVPCQTRRHSHPHPHHLCPAPTRCRPPIRSLRLSQTYPARHDLTDITERTRSAPAATPKALEFGSTVPAWPRGRRANQTLPSAEVPSTPRGAPSGEGADNAPGLLQAFSPIAGDPANGRPVTPPPM